MTCPACGSKRFNQHRRLEPTGSILREDHGSLEACKLELHSGPAHNLEGARLHLAIQQRLGLSCTCAGWRALPSLAPEQTGPRQQARACIGHQEGACPGANAERPGASRDQGGSDQELRLYVALPLFIKDENDFCAQGSGITSSVGSQVAERPIWVAHNAGVRAGGCDADHTKRVHVAGASPAG